MGRLFEPRAAYRALLMAGALTPGMAFAQAQETPPPAPPVAASDEIVVTAQKREQSIIDVPVAVSAYGGEQLENNQIQNLQDLQQIAPSLVVNFSTGTSTSSFIIRGLGTSGTDVGLEQSVGVFIDGVYRGRPGAALVDLTEIERVEVLRGPQGALFGRNTSAGVINILTQAPEEELRIYAEATGGSQDLRIFRGRISGPVIEDKLSLSVSGGYNRRGGFTDDIARGVEVDTVDRWNVRGQALWSITPDLDFRLIADFTSESGVCCSAPAVFYGPTAAAIVAVGGTLIEATPGVAPSIPGPVQFTGLVADTFDREVALNISPDNSFRDGGLSGQFDWDLGDFTLTALGAWREFANDQIFDADFTNAELFTNGVNRDIRELSGELRIASDGDNRFDWLAGASLFEQRIESSILTTLGPDARPYFNLITGGLLNQVRPVLSLINPQITNTNLFAAGSFQRGRFSQDASAWAVYAHGDYDVTPRLNIGGDVRYLQDDKTANLSHETNDPFSQTALRAPLPAQAIAVLRSLQTFETFVPYTTGRSDDAVVGSGTVTYKLAEQVNVYGRYARGFKAGGVNLNFDAGGQIPGFPGFDDAQGRGVDPEQALFAPETVNAYELGLKGVFFDGFLRANLAVFRQVLKDYQVNSFDGSTGVFTLTNAAEARTRGVELEYALRPHPRFNITGAVNFLDAEYQSFPNANQIAVPAGTPGVSPVQDLSGEPPIFSPRWSVSGGGEYRLPVFNGAELIFAANYRYRSSYFTGLDNDPLTRVDANLIADANLTLELAQSRLALQLWVKNVTDAEVRNITFDTPLQNGSYNAFLEPPRTFGGTVRVRY